ncbi:hypothetical protein [Dyadobacter sp. LHD-138]|uniref:hypothetical protein n=1 Tax=Dyadobacter sp. LHD-138 TaxID=3071413 RepID=UPI0027E15A90|nr:hypothetical protein [Dyadobacter sp. LHD-138]MDQ6479805.1 hypothetical protein [Dyadobacter sp. LHD-138]
MATPNNLTDLRLFLHTRQIDHAWLRTVLFQYLEENTQTDLDILSDHQVWDYRNIITEFTNLLCEDPEDLESDEDDE